MGSPTAPVVLEDFSSYQCGFCGLYARDTLPQLLQDYVETGQVLYVFRDFAIRSQPQSLLAAEAANCAGQVGGAGAYWAMHDTLFARQTEWSGRGNAAQLFKGYGTEAGLDPDAFGECLDSGATRDQAEADVSEGLARGVRGTPTFFIDGQPLVGAQPYAVFARAIDAALDKEASSSTALDLAPVAVLSSEIRQLPEEVQEAYRFAVANPEVLAVIPCYCGCGQAGHKNNRMCYVQSENPDGTVVFDDHAKG